LNPYKKQVTSEIIVMGALLDDFLGIDAIIGGIVFYMFADHILHAVRESAFLRPLLKKNKSLVAPSS
jgi:hypothetical protein